MSSLLRDLPAASAAMLAVFDDDASVRAALAFEAALAQAQAAEQLLPAAAAQLIGSECAGAELDVAALAAEAAHAGTLAIPLVRELRALVGRRDAQAAALVHRGATSQDLADTVLMLQAQRGAQLIVTESRALAELLAQLAQRHARSLTLGRTLLQPALPITLGLRAAQWLLGVDAALERFERECRHAVCLQLGGPVGTLTGLSTAVVQRVAAQLGLPAALLPWHARREAIAALAGSLAILIGAVGKLARDVSLLSQSEIAEAFEPRIPGRGGSSSMAHKRNPTGCQVALASAVRAPGLVASMLASLPQELERGLGGWQAEAPLLAELFGLAHGALVAMRTVMAGLELDLAAMQRNLLQADVGHDPGLAAELVEQAVRHYRQRR